MDKRKLTCLIVFGGPPVGNGANIGVFTSLLSNYTTFLVPDSPNNTFVVVISAQLRSPGGTTGVFEGWGEVKVK